MVTTSLKAILLRDWKSFFLDVGDTHALFRLRSLMPAALGQPRPLSTRHFQ